MSDSSFDDDDDPLLMQLVQATQRPAPTAQNGSNVMIPENPQNLDVPTNPANFQLQLFSAQGEISILRAQLELLQNQRAAEIALLRAEAKNAQSSAQEHVTVLKQTVDKLEDEKKFLGNEIRSLSAVKRRKVAENGTQIASNTDLHGRSDLANEVSNDHGSDPRKSLQKPFAVAGGARIQLHDDWSQLTYHLWHYTINGSDRTSMAFLSKICTECTVEADGKLTVPANTPLLACLWDALLDVKHLRLDLLVLHICTMLLALISELLRLHEASVPGILVSVPFLISIVHATITFKPSAVTEALAKTLVSSFSKILQKFVFVLHLNDEEGETFSTHSTVPYQRRLIENFILISALDVLENAVMVSTQFGPEFCRNLWNLGTLDLALLQQILPENTERFVSLVQINLVSSFVEMLSAAVYEDYFCTTNERLNLLIVKSLLKVFIIDIGIKEDFMFYGLNRVLGNNLDFEKISQAVPSEPEKVFNKLLVSMPYPVKKRELSRKEEFHLALNHDRHLLNLRVRIVLLLEAIVVSNKMDLLNLKENIKLIVRIIGYEQNHVIHQPRYELIYMRLTIIAVFVRIFYYMIEEQKNINTLIYPETLYEIFVVLLRIAFASDSLSFEAHELLSQIRAKGVTDMGVFNKSCEFRSREIAHFDLYSSNPEKYIELAGIEGDFANGLEFPYELDTIELAREILSVCVNHDEADNLYYNMNKETQT